MSRSNLDVAGNQQINSDFALDSTQRQGMGQLLCGQDGYWGGGEFVYVRYSATVRQFALVTILPIFDPTTGRWRYDAGESPSTANLGSTLGVAMVGGAAGNFGWVCIGGVVPVLSSASIGGNSAFAVAANGQAGAIAAGKQVVNARILAAATATVVKNGAYGLAGTKSIDVPNSDGWFIGLALSGAGVGAAAKIVSISPDGRTVGVDVANAALVNGPVTGTYNDGVLFYNVAYLNRPFSQGAIT